MSDAFIRGLPKAELHMHLEGSLEPAMLLAFARRNGVEVPWADEAAVRRLYDFSTFEGFSAAYQAGAQVLRTEADFHDLAYAYLGRAAQDNVRRAEVFLAPQQHVRRGAPLAAVIGGALQGLADGARDFGVSAGLIVSVARQLGVDEGLALVEALAPWRDRILGVGLGGKEEGSPPAQFEPIYRRAADLGWRRVAHAGEGGPPEYVAQALDVLGCERIDHGHRSEEDPGLMARLRETQVPLTVCPLSTVVCGNFPSVAEHNVLRLLRAGLCVTINSDDPPYFGGYISDNFAAVQADLGMTDAEALAAARNSFEAAFVDPAERAAHLGELDAYAASQGVTVA